MEACQRMLHPCNAAAATAENGKRQAKRLPAAGGRASAAKAGLRRGLGWAARGSRGGKSAQRVRRVERYSAHS